MKILYDYGAFAMQARGGVSRVMCKLIEYGMRQSNMDCRVWAGIHRNLTLRQLARNHPKGCHGIYVPAALAKRRIVFPLNATLFPLYSGWFKPDICHYSFFKTPRLPKGTKIVVTVHDLINELFAEYFHPRDPQVRERGKALSKADGVVCVSENTRNDLLNWYDLDETRVIVAHHANSLNPDNFRQPALETSYLLYIGTRHVWYKNFKIIPETMASHPALNHYKLVCFGGGGFTASERNFFKELNLDDRIVQIAGDDRDLAGLYKRAQALIYPSRYEGFGLPPLEAMSCECPVVSSTAPPMPEIAGDAAIYFHPESQEELCKALCRLEEQDLRSKLVSEGLKRVQQFSWERSCKKIYDFYEDLASAKS